MIPAVAPPGPAPISPPSPTAQKTALPHSDVARSSAGEKAAANIRAETTRAIDAPQQSLVTQRLREGDTRQRPNTVFDDLVGPSPTFEESPLERQARTALDPPKIASPPPDAQTPKADVRSDDSTIKDTAQNVPVFQEPPPTPSERAEVSFVEMQSLAAKDAPAIVDVAR